MGQEGLGKLLKLNYFIGSQTRSLPVLCKRRHSINDILFVKYLYMDKFLNYINSVMIVDCRVWYIFIPIRPEERPEHSVASVVRFLSSLLAVSISPQLCPLSAQRCRRVASGRPLPFSNPTLAKFDCV